MALVTSRSEARDGDEVAVTLGPRSVAPRVAQRELAGRSPWILVPKAAAVAHRLRGAFPALGERWHPQLGTKTGADEIFLLPSAAPGTRPAIRGRDVSAWQAEPRVHLLWTHDSDGRALQHLPGGLADLLQAHLSRLYRRSDYRRGPPWQLFRVGLACAPYRVVWPDLARRLLAAVPARAAVPLNTVYGIATRSLDDAHALAALLNSRWVSALASLHADPARGGFRRFNAGVVRNLPVPGAESPAWAQLTEWGRHRAIDDDAIADIYELDSADQRALAQLAPDPR